MCKTLSKKDACAGTSLLLQQFTGQFNLRNRNSEGAYGNIKGALISLRALENKIACREELQALWRFSCPLMRSLITCVTINMYPESRQSENIC